MQGQLSSPTFTMALTICETVKGYSHQTFVLIKQGRKFKRKYDDEKFKYQTSSSLRC